MSQSRWGIHSEGAEANSRVIKPKLMMDKSNREHVSVAYAIDFPYKCPHTIAYSVAI
jgi:hypothetical protein